MRAETEVTPPEFDEDEDGDSPSTRISMDVLDVGDVHRQAAIQLLDVDAEDPERNAEAIVAVALAAACKNSDIVGQALAVLTKVAKKQNLKGYVRKKSICAVS